jgi:hypothetical protein
MAPMQSPLRRLLLASGFAVAVAAAPAAAFLAVPTAGSTPAVITACPSGETEDLYTDLCVPHLTPNTPGGVSYSTPGDAYSVPEVQGVPCTGRNTGECIGLEENQPQFAPPPESTLSSSP